jgi:hypothetical protein
MVLRRLFSENANPDRTIHPVGCHRGIFIIHFIIHRRQLFQCFGTAFGKMGLLCQQERMFEFGYFSEAGICFMNLASARYTWYSFRISRDPLLIESALLK